MLAQGGIVASLIALLTSLGGAFLRLLTSGVEALAEGGLKLMEGAEAVAPEAVGEVAEAVVESGFSWSGALSKFLEMLQYDPQNPMLFTTGLFLFVFLIFSFFYGFMRRTPSLRILYVTLFSLYFYYRSSGLYFLLLIFVGTVDFFLAPLLARTENQTKRKWIVALSVVVNLGVLSYFKYTNFLIGIFRDLFGEGFMDFQNIFLPIGISFFVFQSMSYIIDIYRRQLEPLNNWLDYIFYLSFFPQLMAGPIVRAKDFIPQMRQNPQRVSRAMFGTGVFLIATGLFKKMVISDYISLNFVDRIFDNPALYSGFENLMGVYGYGLQIYCDFSGYSDIAIGLAAILGFRFRRNFDSPYKAATITEFWRRWHISLSTWLRDYLYIPLGGNRKGRVRTYINLLITMLLGGLWHGAALRFILWGAIHGVALAGHKLVMELFSSFKPSGDQMPRWRRVLGIVLTFNIVSFGWIFFRAGDMATAQGVISQIFTDFKFVLIPEVVSGYAAVFGVMLMGYLLHFVSKRREDWVHERFAKMPFLGVVLFVVVVVWIVMQFKSAQIQPFIYFQF